MQPLSARSRAYMCCLVDGQSRHRGIASADHGAAGAMATRVSRETPRCPPAGDRRRRRDRRGHGGGRCRTRAACSSAGKWPRLLPGRPLTPHRPCRHAGRAGRRRGERLGGQAADKARSAQGGKESSGDCEACQPAAPRIAKAPARPSPGRALAATKRIGVDSRPGSWCPGLSIPAQLMGQRVRAERRATHCARRETIPTGNGDRSRNASGSVR
jgi:hypothetical protein